MIHFITLYAGLTLDILRPKARTKNEVFFFFLILIY